ncbi:MAG: TenA family transcriptional regulator [Planctomycetes bacterium RBG_16_64_10]|nr:MAG: TenA family transcriptional regulator [Planctomycetes bacterium RBG_16_64_10]
MILGEFEESTLVGAAGSLWREATEAPFLAAIRAGLLPNEAFHRWLVQDYLFVKGATTFLAVAIAKTPRPAQKVLISGLAALDMELDWFEEKASKRGFDLNAPPHPTCRRYVDFLVASAYTQPFEVLLGMLYGVEVTYLCGWSALEPTGPYAEFIDRWSNDQFAQYVRRLLDLCRQHVHAGQQELFNEVLRHEHEFWRMTWKG